MDYVIVDVICDDQPGLGWHCHRPVLKTTNPDYSCSSWTYWASPELGLIRHTRIVTYFKINIVRMTLTFTRYHTLASLQRIFNTRFKKLLPVVFCCNFWTFQQKLRDYICSGCKNLVFQTVLFGHPVYMNGYINILLANINLQCTALQFPASYILHAYITVWVSVNFGQYWFNFGRTVEKLLLINIHVERSENAI